MCVSVYLKKKPLKTDIINFDKLFVVINNAEVHINAAKSNC